jgi:hypothetical protein
VLVRWFVLGISLTLAGCVKTKPVGPPTDGRVDRSQVDRVDDRSVLAEFLRTMAEDRRTRAVVEPCLSLHDRLAPQTRCVLDGFALGLTDCEDGLPHLTARMATRHFICAPHPAQETQAVFDSVLGFLDKAGKVAGKRCADQAGWLAFSADVPSSLGAMAAFGADRKRVRKVADRWGVAPKPLEQADVAEACALASGA